MNKMNYVSDQDMAKLLNTVKISGASSSSTGSAKKTPIQLNSQIKVGRIKARKSCS